MSDTDTIEQELVRGVATRIFREDISYWFRRYAVIKDKSGHELRFDPKTNTGGPVPTVVQQKMFDEYTRCRKLGIPCKMMILKPRQDGASVGAQAIQYFHLRSFVGRKGALMSDIAGSGDKVFEHFRNFAANDDFDWGDGYGKLKPDNNLTDDITLPGGSTYIKVTAGSTNAGRGGTVQAINMTEVAFFPVNPDRDPALAFMGSWYKEGPSCVGIMDSTPNGPTGVFYQYWTDKHNGFTKIFVSWWEQPNHSVPFKGDDDRLLFSHTMDEDEREEQERFGVSLEQLNWRRKTVHEGCGGDVEKFRQEYPSDEISCLTACTRVGTNRGLLKISEVQVGDKCDHGTICAKQMMGVKPVYRLTTRRGYRIRATDNHLLALDSGEFCPVGQSLGKKVRLQQPMMATDDYIETWSGFGGVAHSLKITPRWGAFLGYYMGDGSLSGHTLSFIADGKDDDLHADLTNLMQETLGVFPNFRRVGGAFEIRSAVREIAGLLQRLGCTQRVNLKRASSNREGASQGRFVCVPECIWKSPRPVVREFLRYVFEADGWTSMDVPLVKFFSKYTNFVRDVQRLLLAFGVMSTIRAVTRKLLGKVHPGFELAINARESVKFFKEIGFVSLRKNNGFARSYMPSANDGRCRTETMDDEVVSIEPDGTEEVWDIQIDGEPVFGAGGLLVHNCFLRKSRSRFSISVLERIEQAAVVHPPQIGTLTNNNNSVSFYPDSGGSIFVYEAPRFGCRYVVGFDSCTGRDQQSGLKSADPDEHAIKVWRAGYVEPSGKLWPAKLCAQHTSQLETETATEIAASLSYWYGKAIVVPEVNGCGLYPTKKLIELGVPVFHRRTTNTQNRSIDGQAGWHTNEQTRKELVDHYGALIAKWTPENPTFELWDLKSIHQLKKFVVNRTGRAEAVSGEHDDCVFGDILALFNISLATEYREPRAPKQDYAKLLRQSGWVLQQPRASSY